MTQVSKQEAVLVGFDGVTVVAKVQVDAFPYNPYLIEHNGHYFTRPVVSQDGSTITYSEHTLTSVK